MAISKWLDQRDIPDAKFGKTKLPGCECDYRSTCRVCSDRAVDRNLAERSGVNERNAGPIQVS